MKMIDIPAGDLDGVPVAAFKMAATPVTVAEYADFLVATGHEKPSDWTKQQKHPRHPVVYVNYVDAKAFCKWAGTRLPTGPEWVYACRAGGTDAPVDVQAVAWCRENSGGHAHDVATKTPNAWGLYDMHGNVWEWTSEAVGSYRVLRGGSWLSYAYNLRASDRYVGYPANRYGNHGFRCVASHPAKS